eukprot:CAMPEP_0185193890 /NCGR_PEP_ID=MMETSP1140-20130426/28213_1 /TAXON_ID=298111 /ORGANISM="Pavlova sp., Strain CCMP459" /LENGTH=47 /DNA_ID= /DNA_START= /DNA_END= /DNA_ORIENTATION=
MVRPRAVAAVLLSRSIAGLTLKSSTFARAAVARTAAPDSWRTALPAR